MQGTWIEISFAFSFHTGDKSSPVWGTWIEIDKRINGIKITSVVPRTGDVD